MASDTTQKDKIKNKKKKFHGITRNKKNTVEVYIMVLLRFVNDEMVYEQEELKKLTASVFTNNANLIENPNKNRRGYKYNNFDHVFTKEYLEQLMKEKQFLDDSKSAKECLSDIEVYYYHHRIILKFVYNRGKNTTCDDRSLREFTRKLSDQLLLDNFINKINHITQKSAKDKSSDHLIPYEKRVVLYYSYLVMFINNLSGFGKSINDFLGSLTFRIVESGKIRFGNVHFIRISIPGMNVYYNKKISDFLKTDIINSVYQNALYQKKETDRDEYSDIVLTDFSSENLNKYNVIQEKHLHILWEYAQDNLGGKISDIQNKYIEKKSYLMSLVAIIISIIAIFLSSS